MATSNVNVRIKDLRDMTLGFQDGFNGTSAIDDATIADTDTVLGVDTHVLRDALTIVPVGARFTTAGIVTVREVTATQNSQQWTLDMTAPSAGTFDITLNGATAAGLAFDITGAALQTALEGLAGIGVGQITVAEVTSVHTITFAGTLKNISTNTLSVDGASLTAADSEVLTNTQTGLVTWEITFTPALDTVIGLPADDDAITWYPRRCAIEPETGDFEWTEGANPIIRKSRQTIRGLRRGEDQEMEVTSAMVLDWFRASGGVTLTPYETLHRIGVAAGDAENGPAWLPSSHGGVCEPYSVDIFLIDKPDCGSELAEVFIFPQFAFNNINPGVNSGLINFGGVCAAVRPIIQRVANDDDAIGVIF